MLDIGHDFKQIHPDWFDTLRLTRLPKFANEFGEDHSTFAGVRQSRLGVRSSMPTDLGEIKTIFEFELFGTGVDSGQTTFRLRHAWGELGPVGAGRYWSPFTDPDVFPNSLEYWGPTGLPWYRNVQLRYTATLSDASNLMFALARPGASGDQGVYSDRVELDGIRPRFPLPDFAAAYKSTADWGHIRTAGILRRIHWDDTLDDAFDLSGDATGWGWNVSSTLKASEGDVVRLAFTVGEGVQNEMNDSPIDIGIVEQPSERGDPAPRQAGADRRVQRVPGSHLEREHDQRNRVLMAGQRQYRCSGSRRLQSRALRTRQPALHARAERDVRRRAAVGPSRELLRRIPERRVQNPVLVQVQLLVEAWRLVMVRGYRRISAGAAVLALGVTALSVPSLDAQAAADVQKAVDAAFAKFRTLQEGKNADYIPALAKVDPNLFGIAVVMPDGKVYTAGDVKTEVSIQSISKVFTMAQVIQEQGPDSIAKRIGVDATGARFNSIIAVEGVRTVVGTGAPEMNPLVNPGAISATSMVTGANADEVWKKIIGFHNDAGGPPVDASCRTSTSPSRTPTSATRRSARSCSPTATSRATGSRRSISTPVSAR